MMEYLNLGLKKRNLFIPAIVLLFFVLVFPNFARFYSGNDSLVGSESYYHLRASAELIKEKSYNLFNPPEDIQDMAYSHRNYVFNPYHYFLVYASSIFSLQTSSRIAPFLAGVLSLLVFNLILKRFIKDDYKRHVSLILLVLNPAFIYLFTVSNANAAVIVFSLLGFYFFMNEGRIFAFLSLACLLIVSLFSLFNTVLVLLLLLSYILLKRKMQSRFVVTAFMTAFFSLAMGSKLFYNYAYEHEVNIISSLFSDLGGMIGFGIFSIVLAAHGVVSNWKDKSDFLPFFGISTLLFVCLFFFGSFISMYLAFFVAVAGGMGFVKLTEEKSAVPMLKDLSILILICGILFSTISYLERLESLEPDKDMMDSLAWMRDNAFKDGFVLSHYDEGYLISTVARNPVLTDAFFSSGYDQRFTYKVQDSLFYGRKLDDAKTLFKNYNIRYIYITPRMRSDSVWTKQNEGLLFLLNDRMTFTNVYDKNGVSVWEVMRLDE